MNDHTASATRGGRRASDAPARGELFRLLSAVSARSRRARGDAERARGDDAEVLPLPRVEVAVMALARGETDLVRSLK